MTHPQETIAQVLREHRGDIRPVDGWEPSSLACVYCRGCGHEFASHTEHYAHVSQVITEALGLHQEWAVRHESGGAHVVASRVEADEFLAEFGRMPAVADNAHRLVGSGKFTITRREDK